MDCQFIKDNLIELAEGHRGQAKREACARHRQACARCDRLLTRTEAALVDWDPAANVHPSPSFVSAVVARAGRKPEGEPVWRMVRDYWQVMVQPIAAAALLVGAVWVGAYLGGVEDAPSDAQVATTTNTYYDVLTAYPGGSPADFYLPDVDEAEGGQQ